jgi:hypothetical protein
MRTGLCLLQAETGFSVSNPMRRRVSKFLESRLPAILGEANQGIAVLDRNEVGRIAVHDLLP